MITDELILNLANVFPQLHENVNKLISYISQKDVRMRQNISVTSCRKLIDR